MFLRFLESVTGVHELFVSFQYYPSLQEDSDEERDRRPSEDCDVSEAELATEDGERAANATHVSPTCS